MTEPHWITETRAAHDTVAVDYARLLPDVGEGTLDRAMLATFAEQVRGSGPVVEVGCGTGRITAHLRDLGLDVSGVDLSAGVAAQVAAAGFTVHPRLDRERADRERGPQSFLLAVRTDGVVDG